MTFWIAAIAVALATAVWVARPLTLARRSARPRAAFDEQVFRDQLAEVDRDLDRGVLSAEEARAARIEVSRRLLGAAAERAGAADLAPAPRTASLALAALLLVGAPVVGLGVYGVLGAPGLPDQPAGDRAAGRPGQEVAEALSPAEVPAPPEGAGELVALIAELEERVAGPEPERQGLFLLARSLSQVGRFADSWRAYSRLIDSSGGDAPGQVFAAMAEGMILATRGYVSPEAEAALEQALRRAPDDPIARYYLGAAYAQTGRAQSALETWASLVRASPPDAPWLPSTRAQMAEIAKAAGLPLPDAAPMPEATPEQARAGLAEVVAALDARLAAEGGPPEVWAQLARSYGAMGEAARATDAAARARAALAADPAALAAFETALAAGVADPAQASAPAAPPPGPDAAAVTAAGEMSPEERSAMIRGMVDRLRDRLHAEGGDAEEWARLIQSLGVLGDADGAADAYARAMVEHGADSVSRAFLKEQALLAGAEIP